MKTALVLTAILASMSVMAEDVVLGPSGGMGGGYFADLVPAHYKLVGATLCGGSIVDSIQAIYSANGQIIRGTKHGGNGGSCQTLMTSGSEFIIEVYGCRSSTTVTSLEISTNTGQSIKKGNGTCASHDGNFLNLLYSIEDSSETLTRRIRGFSGRSGSYLDAIGVVAGYNADNPFVPGREDGTLVAGLSGGLGGAPFYDYPDSQKIDKLTICSGTKVDSIRVNDGQKYGGNGGACSSMYFAGDEYIREITGHYDSKGSNGLTSMNVTTTNGRVFRFGAQDKGINYSYKGNNSDQIIVGLSGRSGDRIDAIGVFYR